MLNLVILFLTFRRSCYSKFSSVLRSRETRETCLLLIKYQKQRNYNLPNQKVHAFLPAYWGNWGPDRAKSLSWLMTGTSTSILGSWIARYHLAALVPPLEHWYAWISQNKWKQLSFLDSESFAWRCFIFSLASEASTALWQMLATGSQGANPGLHLVCIRVVEYGLKLSLHQKNSNSPTFEMEGLLKYNYKCLISSQENEIVKEAIII